jgi:uncharacterized membrane protein YccF (DUF307 family)
VTYRRRIDAPQCSVPLVWLALGHMIAGILLCLTIIGIPLGIASFKMAGLALAPLGKTIVPNS